MKQQEYEWMIRELFDARVEDVVRNIGDIKLVRFDKEKMSFPSGLETQIATAWENEVQSARSAGRAEPRNNRFVHCKGVQVAYRADIPADLVFNCGETDFMHYSMLTKVDPTKRIWGIGTTGVTYFTNKEGERVYVFATRDHTKVKNVGGKIEAPPGGYLDIGLVEQLYTGQKTTPSTLFWNNTEKEFEEELCLPPNKIKSHRPVEVIRILSTHDISVDYVIELDASEEELRDGFRRGKKYGGEHATQFFIPESKLAAFVQDNQGALTPRTKSNLRNYLLTTPTLVE